MHLKIDKSWGDLLMMPQLRKHVFHMPQLDPFRPTPIPLDVRCEQRYLHVYEYRYADWGLVLPRPVLGEFWPYDNFRQYEWEREKAKAADIRAHLRMAVDLEDGIVHVYFTWPGKKKWDRLNGLDPVEEYLMILGAISLYFDSEMD